MEDYKSRKFVLSMAVLLSSNVFLAFSSITPEVWAATVGSMLALYMAGNVSQKALVNKQVGDGQ